MTATGRPVLDPLIGEARARARRRRLGIALAVLACAAGAPALARSTHPGAPRALGVCATPPSGWRARAQELPGAAPQLALTNFRFGRLEYLGGHDDPRLHWPRGGVLITISDWTSSSTAAMRSRYLPVSAPLVVRASDFAPFEGVRDLGRRQVALDGRLLEVWVQPRPLTPAAIAAANRELARVSVCG